MRVWREIPLLLIKTCYPLGIISFHVEELQAKTNLQKSSVILVMQCTGSANFT